ncbi:hypothetical protein Afil01_31590 [Actinorhabdospora filicis]|uniref:Type I-E CRISPR-associated protein Cse2/CasB n=1 Tax=Actinorhabdospora filicis TaxID=1785913 RepID=A0A9W6W3N5_9ACTN|nr:type I-E CRISPR-associated protein Cse2/CasB [Actinorhabdospora filicis]GLZ78352.1 hypothetical protein Afil01_31590 [Actinorhabdospora filicis]
MTSPATGVRAERLARAQTFLARLGRVTSRPGPRSVLRRGLGRPMDHQSGQAAFATVIPLVPADDIATDAERAHIAIACLIASTTARDQPAAEGQETEAVTDEAPEESGEAISAGATSLGRTLALAVNGRFLSQATTQARLHHMCRQDLDGVLPHLPRLVGRLKAEAVPIDWAELLVDLSTWNTHRPYIAARWLRDYHRSLTTES